MSSVPAYTQHGTAAEWSLLGGALQLSARSNKRHQSRSQEHQRILNVRYAVFLENQSIKLIYWLISTSYGKKRP